MHMLSLCRFGNEVAGVEDLGTTGRGGDMQVFDYFVHYILHILLFLCDQISGKRAYILVSNFATLMSCNIKL